jgi:hypothetical protein
MHIFFVGLLIEQCTEQAVGSQLFLKELIGKAKVRAVIQLEMNILFRSANQHHPIQLAVYSLPYESPQKHPINTYSP